MVLDTEEVIREITESGVAESSQGSAVILPAIYSSYSSIESMTREEVLSTVDRLVKLSEKESNLDYIFGSNGMVGKSATGNYSLLARGIEILFPPGLSRSHISNVLRGKVGPSHETLRSLSQLTGISIDRVSGYIMNKRIEK